MTPDTRALETWMDAEGIGSGPLGELQPVSGGTQNTLHRFERDGVAYVLRRAPATGQADGRAAIDRESRILAALRDSGVPHPRIYGTCLDEDVLGTAFMLVEAIDACFSPRAGLPAKLRDDHAAPRRMGLSMVDGIAAMSRADPADAYPDAAERATRWLARQPSRWCAQLESYGDTSGYTTAGLPDTTDVVAWLEANRPFNVQPGVIHGDFHFANVLMDERTAELRAIVDWELATVGDPLLDLGHLIATWPGTGTDHIAREPVAPGLPSTDEIIARYLDRTGRDPALVPWFLTLAAFRLGVLLDGTCARACAGQAPHELGAAFREMTVKLFRQAQAHAEHEASRARHRRAPQPAQPSP